MDDPVKASATGGFADDVMRRCSGSRLVIRVEAIPYLSSTISIRRRRWLAVRRSGPHSSMTQQLPFGELA